MALWECARSPGSGQVAAHEYETIGHVISGRVELRLEDETTLLGPGDSWRVPEGVAHSYTVMEPLRAVVCRSRPPNTEGENSRFDGRADSDPLFGIIAFVGLVVAGVVRVLAGKGRTGEWEWVFWLLLACSVAAAVTVFLVGRFSGGDEGATTPSPAATTRSSPSSTATSPSWAGLTSTPTTGTTTGTTRTTRAGPTVGASLTLLTTTFRLT
jgi:hypothetical protein